jgi:KaiC/GvpD/RAD55 family RecA-like ATPase
LNQDQALHVPIISDILGLPVRRGKVLVCLYEPSAQWISLIITLASELLRRGHVVGITTLTTPPSQVREQLANVLTNLKEHEAAGRFAIIDWYTWMTGKKSPEPRSVDSLAMAQFNIQDSGFQRGDSARYDFLASDSLSAFLKYNDERAVMQWLDKTVARMRELRGVRLYGFVKRFHSDAFYANLEAMMDGVIELDNRERGRRLETVLRLTSIKGMRHPTEWQTLKMSNSGLLSLASRN